MVNEPVQTGLAHIFHPVRSFLSTAIGKLGEHQRAVFAQDPLMKNSADEAPSTRVL